jgi:hypothetical protein
MAILARDQGIFRGQSGPWMSESGDNKNEKTKLELGDFAKFALFLQTLCRERGGKANA